jgi:hypothetical protein
MPALFLGAASSVLVLLLVLAVVIVRGSTSGPLDSSRLALANPAAATMVLSTATPAVLVAATLDAQATAQTRGTTAAVQQAKELGFRVQTAIAATQAAVSTATPLPATPIVIVIAEEAAAPEVIYMPMPAPAPALSTSTMVVNKRYGAALRVSPSSDAAIVMTLGCGSPLQVVSPQDNSGWILIRSDYSQGWIGGVRLRAGSVADPGVCAGAPYPPYSLGQYVRALVQTGCLSVRPSPSANASIAGCVESGHYFQITNGPIEVDREDWFAVRSTSTGLSGWTRAQYLIR